MNTFRERGEGYFATRVEERKISEGRILIVLDRMRKMNGLCDRFEGRNRRELGVRGGILAPVQKECV